MAVLEKLTHFDNDGSDDAREGFDFRVLETLAPIRIINYIILFIHLAVLETS